VHGQDDSFASLLRRHREQAGLTQEELADRAGLTPHAVSALERGARTRPYPHTVRSLADALRLDDDARAALLASVPRRASSAPAEAAPTAHTARTLPAPATALLGREAELDAVVALLDDPSVRLVTLTGLGGVGKTRLALAVAARVGSAFPGGVVWVPLAALDDPALVLPAVGHALGASGAEGPDVLGAVSAGLSGGRTLLVVDNLEHLLAAAPDVGALLEACPEVTVLASSRAALRVRGEHEHAVAPLPVPRTADLEALAASPAVALLLERARAVSPSFAVTAANAEAVAGLCTRLAGIPLALELAAAKVRLLDPAALLARLDTALASGGARDLPARQRTMRATLDWSHDLLEPAEQRLFARLGVFGGGFTLEAAEAVAEPGDDVVELLSALVEHSLVQVGADDDGRGTGCSSRCCSTPGCASATTSTPAPRGPRTPATTCAWPRCRCPTTAASGPWRRWPAATASRPTGRRPSSTGSRSGRPSSRPGCAGRCGCTGGCAARPRSAAASPSASCSTSCRRARGPGRR
jgi:predicted ATPase/transcriptional regulator with XRE-family HTH domain